MSQDCTDNSFLESERRKWEAYLSKPLSIENTREIIENISGVFRLLDKWDRRAKNKETNNE